VGLEGWNEEVDSEVDEGYSKAIMRALYPLVSRMLVPILAKWAMVPAFMVPTAPFFAS